MPYILQVDFPYTGPWGNEMAEAMSPLAESIIAEPGFIWKIWTVNEAKNEAGGIYLFADVSSAECYLKMHTARLSGYGITQVNSKIFDVHRPLSDLNRGPVFFDLQV